MFREQYRCYSMVFSTKNSEEIKHGGKIIMPPSALEKLARLNITYPMLFKLRNTKEETQTHCGVLEFVAEEGRIYVPHWVKKMNENVAEYLFANSTNNCAFSFYCGNIYALMGEEGSGIKVWYQGCF